MSTAFGVLLFVLALALVGVAVLLWLRAGERWRAERLMTRLSAEGAAAEGGFTLRDPALANPIVRWVSYWLWRIGYDAADPDKVARGLLIGASGVPLLLLLFGVVRGLGLLLLIAAFGYLYIARRAAQRRARILEQLPDFLEVAMRVLSAGNTLEEALAAAARESPEPIRPLFVSISRQLRLGAPIEEVVAQAADIHRIHDLKVMALAASINRKYGGSLRNVMRSLIQAIRTRETAARELRALTAETRFSAVVLAIIPAGLTGYILMQNPTYYAQMWATPVGKLLLSMSVLLQVAGVYVLWRMMRSTEAPA